MYRLLALLSVIVLFISCDLFNEPEVELHYYKWWNFIYYYEKDEIKKNGFLYNIIFYYKGSIMVNYTHINLFFEIAILLVT